MIRHSRNTGSRCRRPHSRGCRSVAVALLCMTAASGPSFGSESSARSVRVTTKRDDDRTAVAHSRDQVVVSIHSPFGISKATLERAGERWPETVLVRLHLKGLENFKLSSSKVKLAGSAFLDDGKPRLRLWKDGEEDRPIDKQSPYWVHLRIVHSEGRPQNALPLDDGYFELRLPQALLDEQTTITIEWIDFYRG